MRTFRINAYWATAGFIVLLVLFTYWVMKRNTVKTEGAIFRERIIKEFHAKAAIRFDGVVDLTSFCKAARFEGMPVAKVQKIFVEAGGKQLVDVNSLPVSVQKVNDFDYLGSFDVGTSLVGNATFSMSLRVYQRSGHLAVREISHCGVTSVSL